MNDLEKRFTWHPPKDQSVALKHAEARIVLRTAAEKIVALMPPGSERERATAITKIEEAMMWANAGIARHSP